MKRIFLTHLFCVFAITTTAWAQNATLELTGADLNSRVFTRDELRTMSDRVNRVVEGKTYTGVRIAQLFTECGLDLDNLKGKQLARTVVVWGSDKYLTTFALAEFIPTFHDVEAVLADTVDGGDLPQDIGPFRVLTSDRSARARWVGKAVRIVIAQAPKEESQ